MEADDIKIITTPICQDPFQEIPRIAVFTFWRLVRITVKQQPTKQHLGSRIGVLDYRVYNFQHFSIVTPTVIGILLVSPTTKYALGSDQRGIHVRFISQFEVLDIKGWLAVACYGFSDKFSIFLHFVRMDRPTKRSRYELCPFRGSTNDQDGGQPT